MKLDLQQWNRLTVAALILAVVICATVLVRVATVQAPIRAVPPLSEAFSSARARTALTEQAIQEAAARDPFRIAALEKPSAPPSAVPAAEPEAKANLMKLVGVAMLPSGGLALVESSTGSRVMRIGQTLNGMVLREVSAAEAVFTDSVTGERAVFRIRKAGP
ncbi:MAG: hypothetical protein WEE89_07620 [Gemmatimonadota bacterium]